LEQKIRGKEETGGVILILGQAQSSKKTFIRGFVRKDQVVLRQAQHDKLWEIKKYLFLPVGVG
jgi:hypothetical protein